MSDHDIDAIKEYHFHIYFELNNTESRAKAMKIREGLENLIAKNILKISLYHINDKPVGPHPIGSYEVWVPREEFTSVLSWVTMNRDRDTPVLIHPLTRHEILDHTERAIWMGQKLTLNLAVLSPDLGSPPLQNPHFKLGYSKE